MQYFPLSWPFLVALGVLLVILIALIELRILTHAYVRIGIPPRAIAFILLMTFLGSYVNIPIARLQPERLVSDTVVSVFGMDYVVPTVHRWPGTVICINVGGALIPMALAFYLILEHRMYVRAIIATAVVAAIVHRTATPVRGVGITVPILVPALTAAGVAMLLDWRRAPPLAYIAGSLGTLIGADLLNLGRLHGLGAPVASIGGAGTFDGVFLSGIIAVLLPPVRMKAGSGPGGKESDWRPDYTTDARRGAGDRWR